MTIDEFDEPKPDELRAAIREGLDQAERVEVSPFDERTLEEVKVRGCETLATSWNDLPAFLEFARKKLAASGDGLTLDDVLAEWDYETQSEEEKAETLEAIRRGFDDVDHGRTVDAFEAISQIRKKLNLPPL